MPYRDLLVQQIMAAGQKLVDSAESLVPENLTGITDCNIRLSFPQSSDNIAFPCITMELTVVNEVVIEAISNFRMKECKTINK